MNDSFELLSSMSPKLKGRQKTVKKAIKILALKKNIRRSSVYDKIPAVNNKDLAIIEASKGTSETSSFGNNVRENENDSNKNNVIIIDSTDSEDEEGSSLSKANKLSSELLKKCNKNEAKVDRIQDWLNNIDLNQEKDDLTLFSQVSTVYGDEAPKFDPDGDGLAACSTFNEYVTRRFDELFISGEKNEKPKPSDDLISEDSFSININTSLRSKLKGKSLEKANKLDTTPHNFDSCNDSSLLIKETKNLADLNDLKAVIIDETLMTSDESIVKSSNSFKSPELSPCRTPEQSLVKGQYVTTRKKNDKFIQSRCSNENPQEMETMLDSLYGAKWREKQNHVLPLSEPKKKPLAINEKKIVVPNTERILKPSNKDNTQNKLNPYLKKLNFDKLRTPITSPWVERLKGLVDSDSDNNVEDEKGKGIENVKTRLDFCQNSPLTEPLNVQHTDNGFDKKFNLEDSYLQYLEKRKKNSNNKNINKKDNPNKENKGKMNNKQPQKENKVQPVSDYNSTKKSAPKGANKKTLKSKIDNKTNLKNTSSSNGSSDIEISSDEEYDKEITRMCEVKRKSMRPLKEGKYSFLESLSGYVPLEKCDVTARIFRTSFKHYRDELKKKLFSLYNEKVFDSAIPSDTELEWNDKLRNTAGLCYCKKITHRGGNVVRKVKIALSSKVLDSPDRLRDTLIHEMCHAATWIANQVSNGHGVYWKNWAFKAMRMFPELPPIKRCHSYQINTKYTYKCTGCGYSIGRHSKSLDTERKRCGHCYGKFELLINKTNKSGETKSVPVTPRKQATGFSLFVKENYARYKEPFLKHGDVMKILGQKFSEMKVKNDA